MKLKNTLAFAIGLFVFSSCIDNGAAELIDFTPFVPADDTTYVDLDTLQNATPQPKNVLIEDFTGVKCSNCPDAAKRIKDIKVANPDRVVSIGIHTGDESFTHPKSGYSKYDFRTADGDRLGSLVGPIKGLPTGAVDRTYFEDAEPPAILINRLLWDAKTSERLNENNPVNISITSQKNDGEELIFLVRVLYEELVSDEDHFLSVYITEDEVVDYQYDWQIGDIKDYKHEHIFRKNLTSTQGDSLVVSNVENPYVEGRVFQRRFVVPIKKDTPGEEFKTGWNSAKLTAVAIISRRNPNDYEVIHVVEEHLGN